MLHPVGWVVFTLVVVAMLAIDLGIGQRRAHAPSMREAAAWSAVWIAVALLFNLGIWHGMGAEPAMAFLAGYLIEKSLSVDNLFVFVIIFHYFGVGPAAQPRVLKWGIIGAVVMRAIFIAAGAAILRAFHGAIYVFGAFLVWTGIQMLRHKAEEFDPEKNWVVRIARRRFRVVGRQDGPDFFVRTPEGIAATPVFLALLAVESTDVVFALDSIPAIFAITDDAFIVYTSNIFAILGLRALYFLLAGMLERFRYLKVGISAVLVFVGVKMLVSGVFHVPVAISLLVVATLLGASVAVSVLVPARPAEGK